MTTSYCNGAPIKPQDADNVVLDQLGRKYKRQADRARCHRQDNPLPRPSDDALLEMYASMTASQIANDLGRNANTVRSWINRAQWR